MWTGLVWLMTGTSGELLWIRYWTFGCHEMLGNYRVAWRLVASRVVLSSIELVSRWRITSPSYSESKNEPSRYQRERRWSGRPSADYRNLYCCDVLESIYSALKMKATCFSEISVNCQKIRHPLHKLQCPPHAPIETLWSGKFTVRFPPSTAPSLATCHAIMIQWRSETWWHEGLGERPPHAPMQTLCGPAGLLLGFLPALRLPLPLVTPSWYSDGAGLGGMRAAGQSVCAGPIGNRSFSLLFLIVTGNTNIC
jgi:hypothetical protein